MKTIHYIEYKSPYGVLILGDYEGKLCLCDWKYRKQRTAIDDRIKKGLNAQMIESKTPLIEETIRQLDLYFNKKLKDFEIPMMLVGTEFQKSVWEALIKIPFGKTMSYMELSIKLLQPKAIRAIAAANGANALSILIPCHRIIGSDGALVGYAGGLECKKKLLQLENHIQVQYELEF